MKSIVKQIIFFVLVFNGIAYLRELSMLSSAQILPEPAIKLNQAVTLSEKVMPIVDPNKKNLIYFFAPWCQICNASISNLEALKQQKPELNIVAVALDYQTEQEVITFTAQHQLTMPIVLGSQQLKNAYKIKGYPSYYVIDKDYEVQAKSLGYSTQTGMLLRSL